jgi:Family of unknown function (DUF6152)
MAQIIKTERFIMKSAQITSLALMLFLLLCSSTAFAHHGTANYDTTKLITVKSFVTRFQFINPHVIISMDAKDEKGTSRIGKERSPARIA